ncbi:MAG: sulfate adenylyltransferase, partial [Nitrospirae bacterium CG_4_9_14_3_um_filter_44_28]
MIKPHGSDKLNPLFVYDTAENEALYKKAEKMASIVVSSAAAANAVMMGGGYFNPLTGYMNKADALSVANNMKTTSGLFWPVPILNLVKEANGIKAGDRIALKDPNVEGNPILAVMDVKAVEEFSDAEIELISEKVFRPNHKEPHPGVDTF